MGTVSFPGLGLEFHLNRVAFHIGSWPVYWYGIIIAAGFLLAVLYCCHAAKRFGIKQDDIIDMLFFAVPLSIVGARLYYILFYLDLYRREDGSLDFGAMVRIWDGGLAIYGGVIMAVVVLLVFCKAGGATLSILKPTAAPQSCPGAWASMPMWTECGSTWRCTPPSSMSLCGIYWALPFWCRLHGAGGSLTARCS